VYPLTSIAAVPDRGSERASESLCLSGSFRDRLDHRRHMLRKEGLDIAPGLLDDGGWKVGCGLRCVSSHSVLVAPAGVERAARGLLNRAENTAAASPSKRITAAAQSQAEASPPP